MDDLISRQATYEKIDKYFGDLPIVVHHDMLQIIEDMPPAQQWIPCEDRCPEKSGDYLICDNCKNMYVNEWHSLLHKWQYDDSRIVAWCELQKPWEGGADA